ncbi:MAG: hypothetical protein WC043_06565 [Pseudobdellovibrionaceae bacterium]
MSLSSTLRRAAAPAALAFMTAFAAANDAHADVAFGCRKPDAVPALQQQVLKDEGMVPVASRFTALSETEFVQETIMMNPQTRKGLEWTKLKDGTVCTMARYSEMEIYDNKKFDGRALMVISGKAPAEVTVNSQLANASMKDGENPMMKATVYAPTNASNGQPTRYVEYMLGNPKTTRGSLLAVDFEGKIIPHFGKVFPTPQEKPVKYGAIYTPVGEDLLKGGRLANAGSSTTLALNNNK